LRARAIASGQTGQAAVLSVVWMVVVLGFAGLVIDVGSWYRAQRNLQAQADASALAGAQDLPNDVSNAPALAQDYASRNGFNLPSSGIQITQDKAPNDSITVNVDKDQPTFFSKLFGLDTVPTRATATARSDLLGAARYVAPITVNIAHPLLSGINGGKQCPCFGVATDLPLAKNGAPGAFGLLDLDNGTGNGSSTLGRWIHSGYDGDLYVDASYSSNTGAKFNSTDIDNALDFRTGTVLLFPVFDTITLQGTNAIYHVIAWVGFKLTGYRATSGNTGDLYGSFTEIIWQGVPATSGNQPPNLGARTISLVH
jgi:Flp pilus assembly protein TadG